MAEFTLPANSKVSDGKQFPAPSGAKRVKAFKIYRWDPEGEGTPRIFLEFAKRPVPVGNLFRTFDLRQVRICSPAGVASALRYWPSASS